MASWYEAMRKSIWAWACSAFLFIRRFAFSSVFAAPQWGRNPWIPTPVKVISLKSITWRVWILFRVLGVCQKLILFSIYISFYIVYSLTCIKVIYTGSVFLNPEINLEFQQNKSLIFNFLSSNMLSNKRPNYFCHHC